MKRFWRLLFLASIVGFAVIDFLPVYGRPHFRYTGSDPSVPVWNFGWPSTMIIYDSRSGFHIFPIALILFPFELAALLLLILLPRRPTHAPLPKKTD